MNDDQTQREQLSALVDGEAASPSMPGVLAYAESDEGQQSWRMYHLIGDVLRSPELAHHSQHDILSGVRAHMEREPRAFTDDAGGRLQQVTAADAAQPSAANASVFRWKMAAGFASVAAVAAIGWGALLGSGADEGRAGAQLAALSPQSAVAHGAAAALAGIAAPEADDAHIALGADAQSSTVVAVASPNGQSVMLRDPRLDELLASRNQFSSAANLQMPASFLRNANFATAQSAPRR